jgi:hypothetical protein
MMLPGEHSDRRCIMAMIVEQIYPVAGSVSNVDIDRNNTLQVKAIGVAISTFETLPTSATARGNKLVSPSPLRYPHSTDLSMQWVE